MKAEKPTVKAVVFEAQRLREKAELLTNPGSAAYDPWAKPYSPSEEAAYKLHQRIANRLERELKAKDPDCTAQDIEDERAKAAGLAIQTMQMRAAERTAARTADKEADRRRRERMQRIQKKANDDRRSQVKDLTVGQRIDLAIARLSVVAAPKAASLEPPITGSKDQPTPMFHGDPAYKAKEQASDLARKLENDVDSAHRRQIEREAA